MFQNLQRRLFLNSSWQVRFSETGKWKKEQFLSQTGNAR